METKLLSRANALGIRSPVSSERSDRQGPRPPLSLQLLPWRVNHIQTFLNFKTKPENPKEFSGPKCLWCQRLRKIVLAKGKEVNTSKPCFPHL